MADTRKWLLKTYGHLCAYCGLTWPPRTLTLDHVTPRRGQTAYDRRDNLVLACKRCNTIKADKSFVAFVLGDRKRAINLFRYGQHLSDGILDMLRPMVGDEVVLPPPPPPPPAPRAKPVKTKPRERFGPSAVTEESPYEEPSPYADAAPSAPRRPIPVVGGTARSDGAKKGRRRRGRRGGRGRGGRGGRG